MTQKKQSRPEVPDKPRPADEAGQSGDTQGLPETPEANSQSVKELAEEGQALEAEIIEGVERAPDADAGEVRTHEPPDDDVPPEYRGNDQQ
jgi:hypothetical protein